MTSSSEGKFDLQIAKIFQKLFFEGVSQEQKMRDGHDSQLFTLQFQKSVKSAKK